MTGHVLIIESRFYQDISDMLLKGAQTALKAAGATFEILTVPGALEMPAALSFMHNRKGNIFDAYVALGCVIRGETAHYDIVCNESARGLYDLVLEYDLALGNGILTTENREQAIVRADPNQKNKGGDAAHAAMRMLEIKREM
ncbi:MAG: 6,7-dimethyl-8-ribityllumazine synthase [Alphaproteobacteria bacterium]|nr:6,7-dimethyl-8-ribityllumazine synthase [Alphaproteobacteria bacterium]